MQGKNLNLLIKDQKEGEDLLRRKKEGEKQQLLGNTIGFKLLTDVKQKKHPSTGLIGSAIKFTIQDQGSWSWDKKKAASCMICKLPLKKHQEATICPMCQATFHKDHITAWLEEKGRCPVCFQELRVEGLKEYKIDE
ncbi:MAG: hypothetical protein GF308_13855 [Candidatus Heimdallarchaeota archaeon]|nr:hypothetical protein [Candidatus Heimdallarchaeota archaeon]